MVRGERKAKEAREEERGLSQCQRRRGSVILSLALVETIPFLFLFNRVCVSATPPRNALIGRDFTRPA